MCQEDREAPAALIKPEGVLVSVPSILGASLHLLLLQPCLTHELEGAQEDRMLHTVFFFLRLCPYDACSQLYTRDKFRGPFPRRAVLTHGNPLSAQFCTLEISEPAIYRERLKASRKVMKKISSIEGIRSVYTRRI